MEKQSGKVYFFHDGVAVKIGSTTQSLEERKWQLQVGSHNFITIIGHIDSEFHEALEKQIHLVMAHKKIHRPTGTGEWFNLTIAEAIEVIQEYKNGKINNYTYGEAYGHPAHFVRPIWRGQQNQTARLGEDVSERAWRVWDSGSKRFQPAVGRKHAVSG
jgi:hypothetical protein